MQATLSKILYYGLRGPGFPFGIETVLIAGLLRPDELSERAWLPVWD